MNFEDESFVKVYKRQTLGSKMLGWDGRAVLRAVFMHVDRAGVLDLDGASAAEAIAVLEEMPIEVARAGMAKLVERGTVAIHGAVLFVPRFLEAQEARQNDAQRQRESRAARVAKRRAESLGLDVTKRDEPISPPAGAVPGPAIEEPKTVTKRDEPPGGSVTESVTESRNVTNPRGAGHAQKRPEEIREVGTPTTIQDLTGSAHDAPPVVVVIDDGRKVPCPGDLELTPAQRSQLTMGKGMTDYQVDQLSLRFRANFTADPSDMRPLVAWRKCLAMWVSSEFTNAKHRPPRGPEDAETPEQTARRLKDGPRQGLSHDHTNQAEHLGTIGANEV